MLVLRRKTQQAIVIDGQIEVSVLEIRGSRVKIGIVAPAGTRVARQEVWVPLKATPLETGAVVAEAALVG